MKNPFEYIDFEALRKRNIDPEIAPHVMGAFHRCAMSIPKAHALMLGDTMNRREREVVVKVMALQGESYRPLHKVLCELSPSDLRVWARVENRLEDYLQQYSKGKGAA